MTILYVGLGIAMISGISAMMQISNNINKLMFLSDFKRNDYFQVKPKDEKTTLPKQDRKIMKILYDYSGIDSDVCSTVKQQLNNDLRYGFYKDRNEVNERLFTESRNEFIRGSCVLVNNNLGHRVLIKKDEIKKSNFNLFSCYFKTEELCPYEENK